MRAPPGHSGQQQRHGVRELEEAQPVQRGRGGQEQLDQPTEEGAQPARQTGGCSCEIWNLPMLGAVLYGLRVKKKVRTMSLLRCSNDPAAPKRSAFQKQHIRKCLE